MTFGYAMTLGYRALRFFGQCSHRRNYAESGSAKDQDSRNRSQSYDPPVRHRVLSAAEKAATISSWLAGVNVVISAGLLYIYV